MGWVHIWKRSDGPSANGKRNEKKWKRSDGPAAIDKAYGPSENGKAQRDRLEMERAVTK